MPKKSLTRGEMARLLIAVFDGEKADIGKLEESRTEGSAEDETDKTATGITLKQSTTYSTTGNVIVTVSAERVPSFIGWQSSSAGAVYSNTNGFTDITDKEEFEVSENGLYAVCVMDAEGNFSYKLIQISNIESSDDSGGSSTTSYDVTQILNGVTTSNSVSSIKKGSTFTAEYTAKEGYTLPDLITVSMKGSSLRRMQTMPIAAP